MSRRLPPREAAAGLSDATWRFLFDEAPGPDADFREHFEYWKLEKDQADLTLLGLSQEALWTRYGADVLRWWTQARPGSRPSLWWAHRAPELRRRLGGVGEPNSMRDIRFGIPTRWTRPIRGSWKSETEPTFDIANPPLFESEAAYLRRHQLLLPSEKRQLTPVDYQPVRITQILWPETAAEEAGQDA